MTFIIRPMTGPTFRPKLQMSYADERAGPIDRLLDIRDQELFANAAVSKQHNEDMLSVEASAVPPIQTIPPEILSTIFTECSSETDVELPPRRRGPGRESYPWVLGHVCSHWRTVLWSTPEIWQNLHISACKANEIPVIPQIVQYIAGRTKVPISLDSLYFPEDSILNAIIPAPERFKDIRLFLTSTSFSTFFNLPSGTFDALEFVAIRCAGFPPSFPSLNTSPLLGAPNLRRVIVQLFRTGYCPPALLLLPWPQLTHLTLIGTEVLPDIVHRTILRQCTSIVDCKLRMAYGKFMPLSEEIVLPHLQKLHLVSLHPLDWDSFLRPFVFPSLEILAVVQPAISSFTSLVVRSNCALRGLTVDAPGADYHDLHHLLRISTSLVELQANCVVPPSLFVDISERGLLPYLQKLTSTVEPEGLEAFLDLLECGGKEAPSHTSLRNVWMECRPGPGMDEVAQRFRRVALEHKNKEGWKNISVWGLD